MSKTKNIIAILLILIISMFLLGNVFIFATETELLASSNKHNVTIKLNDENVAYLYNLANNTNITELETRQVDRPYTNEYEKNVEYNFVYDGDVKSGKINKSLRTKALDPEKFEFVAWATNDVNSSEMNYTDNEYHQVQPVISKDTTITAYYKPIGDNVHTITYKTEAGGILSGGYLPSLKDFKTVCGTSNDDACDFVVDNTDTYVKGVNLSPVDEGYVFKGWYDGVDDSPKSTDLNFKPNVSDISGDVTYTAKFENKYVTINYSVEGSGKTKTVDESQDKTKDRGEKGSFSGVKAVPNSGNNFVGWVDSEGKVVSINPVFIPSGDLVVEGATYTAVFSTSSEKKVAYLVNNENYGKLGKFDSSTTKDLTNKIEAPYSGTITGVPNPGYELDFLSVNGSRYSENSIHTSHAFAGTNGYEDKKLTYGCPTIIKAYFRPTGSSPSQDIKYEIKNESGGVGVLTNEVDYIYEGGTINGCTAINSATAEFVEWQLNGKFYSSNPTITPTSKEAGNTYVAVYKSADAGKLVYNINLTGIEQKDITWIDNSGEEVDINDYFEHELSTTSKGCLCYKDKKTYFKEGDTISVFDITPQIDGYVFVGWFDKQRDGQDANIYNPNDKSTQTTRTYIMASNKEYTIDALWVKIKGTSAEKVYNAKQEHTIDSIQVELDTSVFESIQGADGTKNYLDQFESLDKDKQVKYKNSESDSDYTFSEPPKFKDVGEYDIYYELIVTNTSGTYKKEGVAKLVIKPFKIKIVPDDVTSVYGNEFDKNSWTVKYYNEAGEECSLLESDKLKFDLTTNATSKSDIGDYDIKVENYKDIVDAEYANKNYEITVEPAKLTISPRPVVLKVSPEKASRGYGEANPSFSIVPDGILEGDEGKVVYELYELPEKYSNIGDYDILIKAETVQGNYTVSTEKGVLTITATDHPDITLNGYTGEYDGLEHKVTLEGTIPGDKVEYSIDGGDTWTSELPDFKDVTDTTIKVKVTNPNTTETVVESEAKVEISPKEVTVVAQDKVVNYNEDIPDLDVVIDGVIGDDVITYNVHTNAKKGSDSGTYDIEVEADENQGNYIVKHKNGKLTISKNARKDLEIKSYVGVYDAKYHSITINGILEDDIVEYSLDGKTWSNELPEFINITDSSIVYVKLTNKNAEPQELIKSGTVTITPIEIVITADSKSVKYNEKIPELTANVTETYESYKIKYELSTTAKQGDNVGEYPITVNAQKYQDNYVVSVVNSTLSITPIDHPNLDVSSYNGEYDGEEHSILVNGIIPGDKVEYSIDGVNWTSEIPKFKDEINGQVVYIRVTNPNTSPSTFNASATVTITAGAKKENKTAQTKSAGTGDNITFYIAILTISLILIIYMNRLKRKPKRKSKH